MDEEEFILTPSNLYKYTSQTHENHLNLERTKVAKDFCFPDGVLIRKLDYDPSQEF